jgi:hypothetical protein
LQKTPVSRRDPGAKDFKMAPVLLKKKSVGLYMPCRVLHVHVLISYILHYI